jgi:hypothetical protein
VSPELGGEYGGLSPLGEVSAHGRHHAGMGKRLPRLSDQAGVTPVEGVKFRHNSHDVSFGLQKNAPHPEKIFLTGCSLPVFVLK